MNGHAAMTLPPPPAPRETAIAAARVVTAVSPERVARALAIFVACLLILGVLANLVIYNLAPDPEHAAAKFMKRFDLGHEPSLPNWYSSLALLAAAALLALIARLEEAANAARSSRWALLAAGFVLLAADEAIMIHEMADAPLHQWLNTSGALYFAWVIPYSIAAICAGLFFAPFVRSLGRTIGRLFLLAGVMYITGAIGIEIIEGVIVDSLGVQEGFASLRLTVAQTLEEGLEMYAIVLFIYALLIQLKHYTSPHRPSIHKDQ